MQGQSRRLNDEQVLHACAGGTRSACAEFVSRHADALWRYARSIAGDEATAEDLLQETFLAAMRGGGGFVGEGSARAWLFTIARNRLHRHHRRRVGEPGQHESLEALGAAAGWGDDPETVLAAAEARAGLEAAIAQLHPADQEILVLRDLEELSGEEAAEVLGVPLATMKTRLHRARLRLVAALRAGGHHG